MRKTFPFHKQQDAKDCGPTCIRIISSYYGKNHTIDSLRQASSISSNGVSLLGLSEAAEKIGFRALAVNITFEQLDEEAILPCILHWNDEHFVVLPPQNYDKNKKKDKILVADPAHGLVKLDKKDFSDRWLGKNDTGIVLLLQPTKDFFDAEEKETTNGFKFLFNYLKPYKNSIVQLSIALLISSALSLVVPFLTQNLVDKGINQNNLSFVYLILISQIVLFAGSTAIVIIRSWILLHMNSRINITIISDFLIKLMKLPIKYFDSKNVGDVLQRIGDHGRVQSFLTSSTLSTIFSLFNLVVFFIVLLSYSTKVVLVYSFFSVLSIGWILLFLKKRKELDYKRFEKQSENKSVLYELIVGMQEIKLNNSEIFRRWEWEKIQAQLYKLGIKSMSLGQMQSIGSSSFNKLKNIMVSYITATEVMKGNMTFGMLVSVSYIVGQLNSPIAQLLGFIQSAQDAKISLERIGEVHNRDNEDTVEKLDIHYDEHIQKSNGIDIKNLYFQYNYDSKTNTDNWILEDINLHIPKGKVTAIVGSSGSGKTTLLKLLLKFYDASKGDIKIGNFSMGDISSSSWRGMCGSVMQEGLIFSDSILRNVAVSTDVPDIKRFTKAVKAANIHDFISKLPKGYNTKIGPSGHGISIGQKQRILIARALYKDPHFLFFDEATSALDSTNEHEIMEHLDDFFNNKTVVLIAHRLSTVLKADKIVVIESGKIEEEGSHVELMNKKGIYYKLVKNQLDLS